MTDQRPQYGELATPEEQRRAAGLPPMDEVAAPHSPSPAPREELVRPSRHSVDRFATIALLAYGLVNVVMTGLSYLDLPTAMNAAMKTLGVDGEFTNFAQGKIWGTIAAIVLVIGWSLTALLSVRRLRSRKRSWWVPLVGAVVTLLLTSICVAVALMGDPAFIEYVSKVAGR